VTRARLSQCSTDGPALPRQPKRCFAAKCRDGPKRDIGGHRQITITARVKREPYRGSESDFQTSIVDPRPRWAERTRIGKGSAAIGDIGDGAGIKEGPKGRVSIVQDVIHARVNLERLVDLIRSMQVENGVAGQLRKLIGLVSKEILAADQKRVASDLECIGDRIIDAS
jgi:hypothetical protein